MIQTCRAAGVRVYADAVVNHMSGGGNDVLNHRNGSSSWCSTWGGKGTTGEKQSPYFTHSWTYEYSENTGLIPGLEFPNAAYIATDFHCERSLSSWTDPFQLNNGWLSGLADLDTENDYVRERIAAYMTDLISKAAGLSDSDVAKVKIWSSDYPKEFPICGYWETPSERLAVQNDCHDDQNPGSSSRDMGDKGSVLVIQKDVPKHRGFEV
jgi:glycosidase